jgi:hypothetical protein
MQRQLALLTAVSVVACGATPASAPEAQPPASTMSAPVVMVRGPARAAPRHQQLASPKLEERLRHHFAQYQGGSEFAFFEQDFAPQVSRYLARKDLAASELARMAKEFYAAKKQVALVVKPGSVAVQNEGERVTASLVLTMRWSVEPPAAAAACGYLDDSMTWRPHSLIARRVEVTARMGFDAAGRIVSYEELPIVRPRLRVASRSDGLLVFSALPTEPARFISPGPTSVVLPDGTIVEDWGETFTCGLDQAEVDTVRKVKVQGRVVWLLADWTYDTGHSFVGDAPLVPEY